jgi:C1A family cysteine protease
MTVLAAVLLIAVSVSAVSDTELNTAKVQGKNPKAVFSAFSSPYGSMSVADFHRQYLSTPVGQPREAIRTPAVLTVTNGSMDWRNKGAVGPVQNQGQMGCPFLYTTTDNIESVGYIAGYMPLRALSIQELESCVPQSAGGCMDIYVDWILRNQSGQIMTAASYPIGPGPCNLTGKEVGVVISNYLMIGNDEDTMATFVKRYGPIVVTVDATAWQMYTSGIITDCDGQQVNHAAMIVGYGTEDGTPYWTIKNSWGTAWGEQGYIRIQRGVDACLVTTNPTIVEI